MNNRRFAILALAALFAMGSLAVAGEGKTVTLEGKIVCAKCTLKEEGREKCQNVLVVEKGDEAAHYWLTSNEVADELGYVCTGSKAVQITGKVTEKDGKAWLAANAVKVQESS